MANVLSPEKKAVVISALVEGCSINSIVRMTGVAKWTILRLLAATGEARANVHRRAPHAVLALKPRR